MNFAEKSQGKVMLNPSETYINIPYIEHLPVSSMIQGTAIHGAQGFSHGLEATPQRDDREDREGKIDDANFHKPPWVANTILLVKLKFAFLGDWKKFQKSYPKWWWLWLNPFFRSPNKQTQVHGCLHHPWLRKNHNLQNPPIGGRNGAWEKYPQWNVQFTSVCEI